MATAAEWTPAPRRVDTREKRLMDAARDLSNEASHLFALAAKLDSLRAKGADWQDDYDAQMRASEEQARVVKGAWEDFASHWAFALDDGEYKPFALDGAGCCVCRLQ